MANFLLKKSYHINNLKISKFKDLWGSHGVFTTIRLVGKPGKLVLFNNHFINLIKSLKKYKIYSKNIEENIKIIESLFDEIYNSELFEKYESFDNLNFENRKQIVIDIFKKITTR